MIPRLVWLRVLALLMLGHAMMGARGRERDMDGVRAGGRDGRRRLRAKCKHSRNQAPLNSFLWTIKRDPPSYLFGTIHVPYTRVWDFIAENTKRAFQRSERVYFELDLTDPYTISDLAKCQLLPHGRNLSEILPRDIYRRIKDHLRYVKSQIPSWVTTSQKQRGLYADYLFNAITGNWERKRPVWVMLMVNSLTESDIRSRGIPVLDLFLAQEAERMEKMTGAVEYVEEQCLPLNHLNLSQVVFALNKTLLRHEAYRLQRGSLPFTTDDLIYHYNCGDLNNVIFNRDTSQLASLHNESLPSRESDMARTIDDYFRKELIYKRNARIAKRVKRLLRVHPKRSFFFAFGAGHFLGNNTIIGRLRQEGFSLEYTDAKSTITHSPPCAKHKCRFRKSRKGLRRRNRKKPQYPSMSADYPMPPLLVQGHVEYHPSISGRSDQGGRKHSRYLPNFNDLWVKIVTPRSRTVAWETSTESSRRSTDKLWSRDPSEPPQLLPLVKNGHSGATSSIPYILPLVILLLK